MEAGLIGSCTNSSYEDLTRAASVVRSAKSLDLKVKAQFIINPGSEQVRYTAERDGLIAEFESVGGVVMANAYFFPGRPLRHALMKKTTDCRSTNAITIATMAYKNPLFELNSIPILPSIDQSHKAYKDCIFFNYSMHLG